MRPWKQGVVAFVAYLCFTAAVLGISTWANHREVINAARRSAVNTCLAANRTHNGVERLVAQLRAQTSHGRLSPALKARYEAGYRDLLADFPVLDCTANPIVFK